LGVNHGKSSMCNWTSDWDAHESTGNLSMSDPPTSMKIMIWLRPWTPKGCFWFSLQTARVLYVSIAVSSMHQLCRNWKKRTGWFRMGRKASWSPRIGAKGFCLLLLPIFSSDDSRCPAPAPWGWLYGCCHQVAFFVQGSHRTNPADWQLLEVKLIINTYLAMKKMRSMSATRFQVSQFKPSQHMAPFFLSCWYPTLA